MEGDMMVTVYFEEYTNDYWRKDRIKTFYTLVEFQDWFFGLCKGKYQDKISIPKPDNSIWKDGPSAMEVNCMWEENKSYWIHKIEVGSKIVFSDGKLTSGMKHWNDEVKQMCRNMEQRKLKPKFNFG